MLISVLEARLQPFPDYGFPEVRINETWGRVCRGNYSSTVINQKKLFLNKDVVPFCKTIGALDGFVYFAELFPQLDPNIVADKAWLYDVKCKGSEGTIFQCEHGGFSTAGDMDGCTPPVVQCIYNLSCKSTIKCLRKYMILCNFFQTVFESLVFCFKQA